jgi:hypothetical protein
VHTDSVWCLAASPDFSLVYSGGRDRVVYATHTALRKAWLLTREHHAVRDIVSAARGPPPPPPVCVCVCVCVWVCLGVSGGWGWVG